MTTTKTQADVTPDRALEIIQNRRNANASATAGKASTPPAPPAAATPSLLDMKPTTEHTVPDRIQRRTIDKLIKRGGKLRDLADKDPEMVLAMYHVMQESIVEEGLRVHVDYPCCSHCGRRVETSAEEALAERASRTQALAEKMKMDALAIAAAIKEKEREQQ